MLEGNPRPEGGLDFDPLWQDCGRKKERRRKVNGRKGRKFARFRPRLHHGAKSTTWVCGRSRFHNPKLFKTEKPLAGFKCWHDLRQGLWHDSGTILLSMCRFQFPLPSPATAATTSVLLLLARCRAVALPPGADDAHPLTLGPDSEAVRKGECFDADGGRDSAVEVREYFIPHFPNREDQDAFEVEI